MIPLLLALACAPDDVDDSGKALDGDADTDTDTDTDADADRPLVGTWLSEGENLSPLFAGPPFNYASILATFGSDGSYLVTYADTSGASGDLTGSYTTDTSTDPATIVLQQATPYTATAEGIYQIDGDVMLYEVVQTEPDYGYSPPTPESGFGTTSGPNLEPGDNVQTYVWQD